MREDFLPFSPPAIGEEEVEAVVEVLRSGWITTGPRVARFEEEFGRFVGAPSLALSSCTAAMHAGLMALGLEPGDAVITTPMTFASTVHVIEHAGARPVLADIEPDTMNLDPRVVEKILAGPRSPRIRALMPVHFAGHPCDMEALMASARERRLAVLEDAAHAVDARYRGRLVGSVEETDGVTRLAAFSFYATKNLTTAEGGMLTGPAEVVNEARAWSLHGMSRDAWKRYGAHGSWYYEVTRPGFKYNMTDIQAALGLVQLRRLPEMQARRRAVVARYVEAFASREELQPPVARADVDHAWHLFVLRLNLETLSIDRDRFIAELAGRKIGASVHFIPIHLHPYYRDRYGYSPEDFPVASGEYRRAVSLPLHPGMSDADVNDVIAAVLDVVETFRR